MSDNGLLNVSVIAGDIALTQHHSKLTGQQVIMGTSGLIFHITPEVAAQWVRVLEPIAFTIESEKSN